MNARTVNVLFWFAIIIGGLALIVGSAIAVSAQDDSPRGLATLSVEEKQLVLQIHTFTVTACGNSWMAEISSGDFGGYTACLWHVSYATCQEVFADSPAFSACPFYLSPRLAEGQQLPPE